MAHGNRDPLVNPNWGENTYKKLKSFNMDCDFHAYPDLFHQMNKTEILTLKSWIEKCLPENPS